MNSALSAATEFNFDVDVLGENGVGSVDRLPEPSTPLAALRQRAEGTVAQHPAVALFTLVALTGVAIGHSSRPIAHARAEAHLGTAKGAIEGEI